MSRIEMMRTRLAALEPVALDIVDDSEKHAGHAGARDGGGHFRLRIVSASFAGMGTAARHRMVYSALAEMMRHDIHALAITAQTPDQT